MVSSPSPPRSRLSVPSDPRDLAGDFACRREVEVRFADTDAMGHVNNAAYLTYFEIARAAYYEAATGRPLPLGVHGAEEGMILADVRVAFRAPAFYGETLAVETRVTRLGRTSFSMDHRLTAPDSRWGRARLIAVAESVLVTYDYAAGRPVALPDDLVAGLRRLEGDALAG
ncbi:MAG: acyl-CoA thioesterase [Chloroflexi bacterium]|nr:acyl-CoA thioesterase [Chloroflexota bacterium]